MGSLGSRFGRQSFDAEGVAGARNPGEIVGDPKSPHPDNLLSGEHHRPKRPLLSGNVLFGKQLFEPGFRTRVRRTKTVAGQPITQGEDVETFGAQQGTGRFQRCGFSRDKGSLQLHLQFRYFSFPGDRQHILKRRIGLDGPWRS